MTHFTCPLISRRTLAIGLALTGLAACAPTASAAPSKAPLSASGGKAQGAKIVSLSRAQARSAEGTPLRIWRRT